MLAVANERSRFAESSVGELPPPFVFSRMFIFRLEADSSDFGASIVRMNLFTESSFVKSNEPGEIVTCSDSSPSTEISMENSFDSVL